MNQILLKSVKFYKSRTVPGNPKQLWLPESATGFPEEAAMLVRQASPWRPRTWASLKLACHLSHSPSLISHLPMSCHTSKEPSSFPHFEFYIHCCHYRGHPLLFLPWPRAPTSRKPPLALLNWRPSSETHCNKRCLSNQVLWEQNILWAASWSNDKDHEDSVFVPYKLYETWAVYSALLSLFPSL